MSLSGVAFPIERSDLYTVWLMERAEVNRHKWLLSEKAGYDVGWATARWNWDMCHRKAWISGMKTRGLYPS